MNGSNNTNDSTLDSLKTLDTRFVSEDGMSKNLMSTVNRTLIYDGSSIDITTDKFWLLGAGSICQSEYSKECFSDYQYDTSTFDSVFDITTDNNDETKIRYNMNNDGTNSNTPCYWWLRSAHIYDDYYVGCVDDSGLVDYYSADSIGVGVLPACTIG